MKIYHTIFNHVLAPITPGPSSSNTAGPIRIGLVCRQLLGEMPVKVRIEYDKTGAFPLNLYGMKSDIAFINGLLGKDLNSKDLNQAYQEAAEARMDVVFSEVDDLQKYGPEAVRIYLTTESGEQHVFEGESLGGGAFCIHSMDQYPMNIQGNQYEMYLFLESISCDQKNKLEKEILSAVKGLNEHFIWQEENNMLAVIRSAMPFTEEIAEKFRAFEGVKDIRTVCPVHPIISDVSRVPVFETPEEMVKYCEEHKCTVAQAAIDYEISLSGWGEEQVRNYAKHLLKVMRTSCEKGYEEELVYPRVLSPFASKGRKNIGQQNLSLGFLDTAFTDAASVMEYSNASGKIVCIPTGGAAGIVPGVLFSAARELASTDEEIYEALMCAGMIGVLMMVDGNEFFGGVHGCQSEVGCGTAMASAALVSLMGGTAQNACDAASMSLQCLMGLVCDPVAGMVQVPCIARNMAGTAIAATCAKSVLAGFDPVIPFGEMCHAMVRTSALVTKTVRNGCRGCCTTPTATNLKQEMSKLRKS